MRSWVICFAWLGGLEVAVPVAPGDEDEVSRHFSENGCNLLIVPTRRSIKIDSARLLVLKHLKTTVPGIHATSLTNVSSAFC